VTKKENYHVPKQLIDNTGFAGAGARENQHRTVQRLDSETLLRVKRPEIQHRTQSLVCAESNSRALARDNEFLFLDHA
jgi:hypothetical protein